MIRRGSRRKEGQKRGASRLFAPHFITSSDLEPAQNSPSRNPCYTGHVVTINDVAKRAGVSPTTAKRAVRAPHLLAEETLKRVQKAIQDLKYEPDQVASTLRSGQSRTIGLVVGNIVEPFFAELIREVASEVKRRGYALLIADNEYRAELELEHLKNMNGYRIGGLIVRSGYGDASLEYLRQMQTQGVAIVEIDYIKPGSPFSHVMLDNRQSVYDGVAYLRGLGHRRIAPLGTYHETIIPEERSLYFVEAMKEVGLSVPDEFKHVIPFTEAEAHRLTHILMALPEPPTALFAFTGNLGMGAYRALRERGVRIPEDVSLLTFDNYTWTDIVDPPIDVIEQPTKEMGLAAVDILFGAIQQKGQRVVQRRFPGRLIERRSVAPLD